MGKITLVLGGARSGKSSFAQSLAQTAGAAVLYVATAEAGDEEMRERIARHRASRPASWKTREEARRVAQAIREAGGEIKIVLVDCLTLLVSNLLPGSFGGAGDQTPASARWTDLEAAVMEEIEGILEASRQSRAEVILVANEVGQGLVPPTALGRLFRDIAGRVNQRAAEEADEVYFLVAGLAQKLK